MTEIAGTMTGTGFEITTYGTNSGSGVYKGQGSLGGAPKPINPKAPPAGARIGGDDTTTIQAFIETDVRSKDFGSLKSYQYRKGNSPNIFVDLKKIAQEKEAQRKKQKKIDDDDDDFREIENQQSENSTNAYEGWLTEHGLKLVKYQSCCPNENVPACRKKIKAATDAAETEAAERAKPRGPIPKSTGFKDNSPFSGQTR